MLVFNMQIKNYAAASLCAGNKEDSKYKRSRMGQTFKIKDEENVLEYIHKKGGKVTSLLNIRDRHNGNVTVVFILTALWYSMAQPVFLSECLSGKECPQCITSDNSNSEAFTISSNKVVFLLINHLKYNGNYMYHLL
jgi:hypothetical protein